MGTTTAREHGTADNRSAAATLPSHHEALVVVQREWNGWRTAMVQLADLEDVHWSQPAGAPRPLIHGYVCCDRIVSGEIPHDCGPAASPHYLAVCVLKRHTAACIFEELSRRADTRGGSRSAQSSS